MKRILALFLCYLIYKGPLVAQEVEGYADRRPFVDRIFGFADDMVDFVSTDTWTFIPALTYAPETSLGIGGRAIRIFNMANEEPLSDKTRPSSLPLTFLYTLNNQKILSGELQLWRDQNRSFINSRMVFSDYPFVFSGIGNKVGEEENYASRYFYYHLTYGKRLSSGVYFGPKYEFRTDDIYQKVPDGLLDLGDVPGSDGSIVSGLGLSLNIDSRDNIFQPTQGMYHQLSWMQYHSLLGSSFNFSQWVIDLRKYHSLNEKQVIAGQAWFSFTNGTTPFQHLSMIGGSDLMRGYFEGRFRDNHAMVYQAEWRFPVYQKLNMVIFGSSGQVAAKWSEYNLRNFKWGGGFGFRYKLNSSGLTFRIDLAYGNQSSTYFGLNEVI